MAMARGHYFHAALACYHFFFVILLAGENQPIVVQAKSGPSELFLYVFANFTDPNKYLPALPGSDSSTPPGFGALTVFDTDLRLTDSPEDPVVGLWAGQFELLRNLNIYLSGVFLFNTTSYSGTVSIQYLNTFLASGEGEITGGSGDFRFARGYVDFVIPPQPDPANVVFTADLHFKYDWASERKWVC